MATYVCYSDEAAVPVVKTHGKRFSISFQCNLATLGDAKVGGAGAFGAADILQMISVPKGTVITGAMFALQKKEGATLTVDIGDDGSPARYCENIDCNTGTPPTYALMAVGAAAGPDNVTGYLYEADNTIDVILDHAAADVAVFTVYLWGVWLGVLPAVVT